MTNYYLALKNIEQIALDCKESKEELQEQVSLIFNTANNALATSETTPTELNRDQEAYLGYCNKCFLEGTRPPSFMEYVSALI